jgi:hypothetical protein
MPFSGKPVTRPPALSSDKWISLGFPSWANISSVGVNCPHSSIRIRKTNWLAIHLREERGLLRKMRLVDAKARSTLKDATAAFSKEMMHAAHELNGPSFAHTILTTAELVAALSYESDATPARSCCKRIFLLLRRSCLLHRRAQSFGKLLRSHLNRYFGCWCVGQRI